MPQSLTSQFFPSNDNEIDTYNAFKESARMRRQLLSSNKKKKLKTSLLVQ